MAWKIWRAYLLVAAERFRLSALAKESLKARTSASVKLLPPSGMLRVQAARGSMMIRSVFCEPTSISTEALPGSVVACPSNVQKL